MLGTLRQQEIARWCLWYGQWTVIHGQGVRTKEENLINLATTIASNKSSLP